MLRALIIMVVDFESKNNSKNWNPSQGRMRYMPINLNQSPVELNRNSVVVDLWLYEVEEAFYQAEDLMDEIFTEALQHRLAAEFQTKSSPVWIYIRIWRRRMKSMRSKE